MTLVMLSLAIASEPVCRFNNHAAQVAKAWQVLESNEPAARSKEFNVYSVDIANPPSTDVPGKENAFVITSTTDPNWAILMAWVWQSVSVKGKREELMVPLTVQMSRQGELRQLNGRTCEDAKAIALLVFSYLPS